MLTAAPPGLAGAATMRNITAANARKYVFLFIEHLLKQYF
jgi:hypothetical protein